MSIKNSNETIGNQTRDLPGCSAVPRPTAPPRASIIISTTMKLIRYLSKGKGKGKGKVTPLQARLWPRGG